MAYTATVFRILLASPSDVVEERRAIPEIINQWNRENSFSLKTVLETVKWETHCTPEMGDRPQEIVNRQVVRNCDVLVGVFWTRLGSPTGKEESGTVEEIQEFIETGKPVMLYFSKVPVQPDSIDQEQWKNLKAFREQCRAKGIVYLYESIDDLRELLRTHLTRTVSAVSRKGQEHEEAKNEGVLAETDKQKTTLLSFASDFRVFLRRAAAEWVSERDSDPDGTDDAKYVLGRMASDLVQYRSRVSSDSGQLSGILAEATKRLKSLQRHQVFLDGGRSFQGFWREGDEILLLLEMVPALLDDAVSDEVTVEKRSSLVHSMISELEANQNELKTSDYSTAVSLRTENAENLLAAELPLPALMLNDLRTYVQKLRKARDIHAVTIGVAGDSMPELLKIEALMKSAETIAVDIIRTFKLFCRYRYLENLNGV